MKTGYDQHFKKVKQTSKVPPTFNVKKHNHNTSTPQQPSLSKKYLASKKEKKSVFPIMPLFSFMMITASGFVFLENFDAIEIYLKKIEVGMESAQAADGVPAAPVSNSTGAPAPTTANTAVSEATTETKKIEDADYLFKLAERKKQLDQREEELKKIAEQIEIQKNEIADKLAKLEETRIKISTALEEKIKADDGKVDTLVQMYSNMKPAQAAKVFESLDEDLVIEILGRMKKKNAAEILNLIKPEKAQIFAERYAGYRTPANSSK